MVKTPKRPVAGLPDKESLVAFLREAGEAEKADIARAFGLKGAERRALRDMLKELEAEGRLGKRGRKGFSEAGALPPSGWSMSWIATPTANYTSNWSRAARTRRAPS